MPRRGPDLRGERRLLRGLDLRVGRLYAGVCEHRFVVHGVERLLLGPHVQQRRVWCDADLRHERIGVHLGHGMLLGRVRERNVSYGLVPCAELRVSDHLGLLLGDVLRRVLLGGHVHLDGRSVYLGDGLLLGRVLGEHLSLVVVSRHERLVFDHVGLLLGDVFRRHLRGGVLGHRPLVHHVELVLLGRLFGEHVSLVDVSLVGLLVLVDLGLLLGDLLCGLLHLDDHVHLDGPLVLHVDRVLLGRLLGEHLPLGLVSLVGLHVLDHLGLLLGNVLRRLLHLVDVHLVGRLLHLVELVLLGSHLPEQLLPHGDHLHLDGRLLHLVDLVLLVALLVEHVPLVDVPLHRPLVHVHLGLLLGHLLVGLLPLSVPVVTT